MTRQGQTSGTPSTSSDHRRTPRSAGRKDSRMKPQKNQWMDCSEDRGHPPRQVAGPATRINTIAAEDTGRPDRVGVGGEAHRSENADKSRMHTAGQNATCPPVASPSGGAWAAPKTSQAARGPAGTAGGGNHLYSTRNRVRPDEPDQPLLVDETEAARLLGMSERKVWQLARDGVLPADRIGGSKRYPREALALWVAMGCPQDPGTADHIRATLRGGAA